MRLRLRFLLIELQVVLALGLLDGLSAGQVFNPTTRISEPIAENSLTVLKGNVHPLARPEYDRGPAPADLALDRILLVLRRGPDQEVALKALLNDQQDKSSANFHAWLTPEQFGEQFGPTENDVKVVSSWLTSHGFKVNSVAKSRGFIEFSGTAAQVKEAFHTGIHKYVVNGEEHWANSENPKIPDALAPVLAGIASLNNFRRMPMHQVVGRLSRSGGTQQYRLERSTSLMNTLFTTGGSGCGLAGGSCYAVGAYDFATIYSVLPLWNGTPAIDGTGQTIAIVAQSDIYAQDFAEFRQQFGLPAGTLNIIYNGNPPYKLASQGDELESDIDVEWSGAVARGATIDFVASASTNTTAGIDLSALYIVDNNLAPILSVSYGACELEMGNAGNQFYSQLWGQAAAQGISVFVSSGDSGAAVCDQNSPIAIHGLAVNGISSTPYNVAVGGTDFNDLNNSSTYWNSTNDPTTLLSAKSYIPETTWNDSCTNSEFLAFTKETATESQCNDTSAPFWPNFLAPVGGSGGASNCITSDGQTLSTCGGGYQKPAWQSGPGVPNDGARDVPDVSFFAADGMNSSFYVACETDIYGGCQIALGGTSVSAPAMAGVMALIDQKMQSRQGNPNYVLYALAAESGASCDSSGTVTGPCIFYDVTAGTIAMPCSTGTPDCITNVSTDANGVLQGYATNAGYDLATGLGSMNVANLVDNWNSVSFRPTLSTLALGPTTNLTHGSPVNINITVAPQNGTGTPSGAASLVTSTGKPAGIFTVTNGAASGTTDVLPGGSYTVSAHYAGDGIFAASDSSPGIPVTIAAEPSTTAVEAFTLDKNGNTIPFSSGPYGGSVVYLGATVSGKSGQGVPTGSVTLTQTGSGSTTNNLSQNPYRLNSRAFAMAPFPDYTYWAYMPGTYTIGASYSGDASFLQSAASAISFTITQAQTSTSASVPSCNLTNGVCYASPGESLVFFANVNYSGTAFNRGGVFASQPTGTITFYSNGSALGPPLALDSNIIPPVASLNTSQLALGPNSITAQYSGDANFLSSTSPALAVAVGETFGVTANPSVINIASPGQSGSTTLTFTAQNGFTGSGTLSPSMCGALPPKSSCSFNPSTVTLTTSTTSVPVTLTITTTAASSSSLRTTRRQAWTTAQGLGALLAVFGVTLLGVGRVRRTKTIPMLFCLMLLGSALSCGGGAGGTSGGGSGGGGGTGGGNNSGTPVGSYGLVITVSINGTTQIFSNVSVNVQ
jgi:hypothetical protein